MKSAAFFSSPFSTPAPIQPSTRSSIAGSDSSNSGSVARLARKTKRREQAGAHEPDRLVPPQQGTKPAVVAAVDHPVAAVKHSGQASRRAVI